MGEVIYRERLFDKREIYWLIIPVLFIIFMIAADLNTTKMVLQGYMQLISDLEVLQQLPPEFETFRPSYFSEDIKILLVILFLYCMIIVAFIFNNRFVIYGKEGIILGRKLPRRFLEIPFSDIDSLKAVIFSTGYNAIELPSGLEETEGVEIWCGGTSGGHMQKGIAIVIKSGKKYVLSVKDPTTTLERLKGHYPVEALVM